MATPVTFTAAGSAPPSAGAPASLQHAYLELREPPADGGTANPGGPLGEPINFQFNPETLTLTKSANWGHNPQPNAESSGPPMFNGAEPGQLTFEMLFDATDSMDDKVVKAVERIVACCVPTERSRHNNKGAPPWVTFHWGGLTSFACYVSQVRATYKLFTPSGTPVRAVCEVTLREISGDQGGQNPTSRALAARDVHVVIAGDTLASVAYRAYGDPGLWREIARANDVDDPMRLRPGARLLVPAQEELGDRHGE